MPKKNSRSYVHAFLLFPDNPEMLRLHDLLLSGDLPGVKYMAIRHEPEESEKKPHFHCMVLFDSQRTPDGVRKSFGVVRTVWRLAHMSLNTSVSEKLKKIPKDSTIESETGYYRVTNWKDSEEYVLKNPDDPLSYIETEYHDGEKHCREPCKIDEVWRLCPVWRVPHVETVSDRCSYAMYMLHRDIQSTIDGVKHTYNYSDIVGDNDFIRSCFPASASASDDTFMLDLLNFVSLCTSFSDFLHQCALAGRDDLIKFTYAHSYLVKQLFEDKKNQCNFNKGE